MMLTPEQLAELRWQIHYAKPVSNVLAVATAKLEGLFAHIDAQQARIAELEKKYLEERNACLQERDKCEKLEQDAARYRWLLHQAWFQEAFDRFDPDDGGMQDRFEKCVAEIADAAIKEQK